MGHVRDLHAARDRGSVTPRRRVGLRWQARWTDPAGFERSRSFPTRDEARQWVTRVEASIRAGQYQLPTRLTVEGWAERFLAGQEAWRASTRRQQESRLRSQVLPAIGALPLEQVSKRDVERLADTMREYGLAPATRRAVMTLVHQIFQAAVEAGHLVRSPATAVRVPNGGSARELYDVLTPGQVDALVEQMPTPAHKLLTQLIAGTGLRIGEARSLTADRLRLDTPASVAVDRQLLGQATSPGAQIAFGPPKGGAAGRRSVAILPVLAGQLREHVSSRSGFVFESQQPLASP